MKKGFNLMPIGPNKAVFEFHISKICRDKYNFDKSLFSTNGNVIFTNYSDVVKFAYLFNQNKETEKKITVAQLNAMGLIDEIYHSIFTYYNEILNPNVLSKLNKYLNNNFNFEEIKKIVEKFTEDFPPLKVYTKEVTIPEYLDNEQNKYNGFSVTLQEVIMLYFANFNPAFRKFDELFSDLDIKKSTQYDDLINKIDEFFKNEIPIGDEDLDIFSFLKKPILISPNDIEGQLKFIINNWKKFINDKNLEKLLTGIGIVDEELSYFEYLNKNPLNAFNIKTLVPIYKEKGIYSEKYDKESLIQYAEYEKFTEDTDWMPKVVLLAKNIYVWLDQLSKKYGRSITKLNEIPDEELDILSDWGFTGLWLIGIWERSVASKKIKNYTGNPEAISSAYSLYDYEIAAELGGYDAYQNLNYRTKIRGIRLACDMVPNHTGIFSKWIIEHPEYFLQIDYPPYPNYSFTGPDLSESDEISIKIEDGYWSKRDAAVVFKWENKKTGEIRYLYHGNDGTNMPWNDTAQLNFLKSEVREAVIQNIMNVAKKFSIIRFDAAMTLTKKHYQRLWFPLPGNAGDIPSRAGFSLSFDTFNSLFPNEFWREVVDRINSEMPNTLLLAEAFWLMEGYFVRTLGMHRVYNSAFMHMLMKEENDKYREAIKNTLEFNPEILKRYVNFMSNPDEETAIRQFGDGDKYFGICMMMVTLPGLPMFAHGQIEGFHEKYGMEYKKSYYNEYVNEGLVRRHEQDIFPLMKKRHLFSQVDNFEFYDFRKLNGDINENIFAYSNKSGNDKVIILYNNSYTNTEGYIKTASLKTSTNQEKISNISNLGEALNLKNDDNVFYLTREYRSGKEFIFSGREINEKGLKFKLNAYQYYIFSDFVEVYDFENLFRSVYNKLDGNGCLSISEEIFQIKLIPIHYSFKNYISYFSLNSISEMIFTTSKEWAPEKIISGTSESYNLFINEINKSGIIKLYLPTISTKLQNNMSILLIFIRILNYFYTEGGPIKDNRIFKEMDKLLKGTEINIPLTLFKIFLKFSFDEILLKNANDNISILDDIRIDNYLNQYYAENNFSENYSQTTIDFIKNDFEVSEEFKTSEDILKFIELLENPDNNEIFGINTYKEITYFNKEKFCQSLFEILTLSLFKKIYNITYKDLKTSNPLFNHRLLRILEKKVLKVFAKETDQVINNIKFYENVKSTAEDSGYNLSMFKELLTSRIVIEETKRIS